MESGIHASSSHPDGDIIVRTERFDEAQPYTDAFSYLSKFYTDSGSGGTWLQIPLTEIS